MAKKQISMTQLKMYEEMIRTDFAPVLGAIKTHEQVAREIAKFEVQKEHGILDLKMKLKELELARDEVKERIQTFTERKHQGDGKYESDMEQLVDARMAENINGPVGEVRATYDLMIRRIRLAGVTGDVASIFEGLPETVANLSRQVARLPKPRKSKAMLKAEKTIDID